MKNDFVTSARGEYLVSIHSLVVASRTRLTTLHGRSERVKGALEAAALLIGGIGMVVTGVTALLDAMSPPAAPTPPEAPPSPTEAPAQD